MSTNFLKMITAKTRKKVEQLKAVTDLHRLKNDALSVRDNAVPYRFRSALARPDRNNIIAEIKRASPSKGVINADIDAIMLAKRYEDGGAAAISVLTEPAFFHGSIDDLRAVRSVVDLPILRKDFTVDGYQILEAANAGADAVLLIVAALDENELRRLRLLAEGELEMDAVVEVHSAEELEIAVSVGAKIIGVNNRDLRTFEVSPDVSRGLIKHKPKNVLMITESGISSRAEIDELRGRGFDGFLIGESLMRASNAKETLGEWI